MDMAAEVKLGEIIEALELASDESSAYFDTETGEVCTVSAEELELAEDETPLEAIPEWERELVEIAKKVREEEGTRYLPLPDKFDIHEWAIMDRFALSIRDEAISADFRNGIRGAGAFRMFKRLLSEYGLWDGWNRFKDAELRQMAIDWCEENGIRYREK